MYNPVKDGIEKTAQSVQYTEMKPPSDLARLVHCFWEIKTNQVLIEDFCLHVLPDACVNILFNLNETNIAAITARQTTYVALNLGRNFHYVGIQLVPGVWRGNRDEIFDGFVDTAYSGSLPLIETNNRLAKLDNLAGMQSILSELVEWLQEKKLVMVNDVTEKIFANTNTIHTVADMAVTANMSPRQLQRVLKQITGFSPHDFLKILRLQESFRKHYTKMYADQSHFIHSFRKITGYTPAEYFKKFDV